MEKEQDQQNVSFPNFMLKKEVMLFKLKQNILCIKEPIIHQEDGMEMYLFDKNDLTYLK